VMALTGPWLVDALYDDRYISSGAIVVVLSIGFIPLVIGMTYDQAALAAGDSRRFFIYNALRSTLQVLLLLAGAIYAGLIGAIVGMSLSMILSHFALIWLARAHHAWDWRHDFWFAALGVAVAWLALWLHWDAIAAMSAAT
jgi:O-antigen/teichoic acid export membrane protein